MPKPVVLIAEELSPATIDALGPDFDVRRVDGTDRPALLSALGDADAVLVQGFQNADRRVVIPGKYSIERDPLSVAKEMIHGFISNIAFEITVQY